MIRIAILGSTGSIGVNALNVLSGIKDKFKVVALSADKNIGLLSKQAALFKPQIVGIGAFVEPRDIKRKIPAKTRIVCGTEGLNEIVSRSDVETVLFAISGSACLVPLITAIKNRKKIALANKESLVSAGEIIMKLADENGVSIIPVDSEHSAIFQCIGNSTQGVSRIYLTGSGGPLLNIDKINFDRLSKKFILNHPRWKMGKKISVDSATMMNKGFEVIEAQHLFSIPQSKIEVLIHPQAVIHSMVEFLDGTILAQLATPDMRLPIQYAFTYPKRFQSFVEKVNFSKIGNLSFAKPDLKKFPALGLARHAASDGGTAPAVLCASDEEAVKAFLCGDLRFSGITASIERVLSRHKNAKKKNITLEDVLTADAWAREEMRSICYH